MVEIRRATIADADALSALLAQLPLDGPAEVPVEGVRAVLPLVLADANRHLLVAVDGGRVLATADALIAPNITHGGRSYVNVENVVVDAAARGLGVGRALMEEILGLARAHDCYKVQLQSNLARTAAHALYESLGFEASARGYRRYL